MPNESDLRHNHAQKLPAAPLTRAERLDGRGSHLLLPGAPQAAFYAAGWRSSPALVQNATEIAAVDVETCQPAFETAVARRAAIGGPSSSSPCFWNIGTSLSASGALPGGNAERTSVVVQRVFRFSHMDCDRITENLFVGPCLLDSKDFEDLRSLHLDSVRWINLVPSLRG
jgi:hypothetical protein